jgi:hypothetical protein
MAAWLSASRLQHKEASMIGFMLAAFMAPPHAPPVDQRLTELENRVAALEARLGIAATASKPAASAPASDFTNPTWHYPEGTTLVRDANGILVPSQAATHISYPGQPMQAAPPPQFYAPPPVMYQQPMRVGPFRFGRGAFRGGANCSGSS